MVKVYKKLLTLLATSTLALASPPNIKADIHTEGDIIKLSSTNNLHNETKLTGKKICQIPQNTIIHRILSYDNGWNLVRYDNHIGYIFGNSFEDLTDTNIYSDLTFNEMDETLQIKENTHLRLDPFEEADSISIILKNNKVKILAKASNGWYLVNNNGVIGFINEKYLKEVDTEYIDYITTDISANLRAKPTTESEVINILYSDDAVPYIEDYDDNWYKVDYNKTEAYIMKGISKHVSYAPIDYLKIAYIEKETPLLESANDYSMIVDYLEIGQTGEVISEEGDYYLVHTFDKQGFIKKNCISILNGLNTVIDISSQKLIIYEDNNILLKTNIFLGKENNTPSVGTFKIEEKEEKNILNNNEEASYWIKYNDESAMCQKDIKEKIYQFNDINDKNIYMDKVTGEKVYKLTKVGTPVIIHK